MHLQPSHKKNQTNPTRGPFYKYLAGTPQNYKGHQKQGSYACQAGGVLRKYDVRKRTAQKNYRHLNQVWTLSLEFFNNFP
jgi:hypothetical protein